jgi:hypothetical protein
VLAVPATSATPSGSATETVVRVDPDQPGLARGRWEAPAWSFYLAAALALVGGIAWLGLALALARTRTRRRRGSAA